jgi:hypothetical protein
MGNIYKKLYHDDRRSLRIRGEWSPRCEPRLAASAPGLERIQRPNVCYNANQRWAGTEVEYMAFPRMELLRGRVSEKICVLRIVLDIF